MDNNSEKIRTPKQDRGIKTKNEIIEAAMRVFSEKGFHGTNTKEIAKKAGVSTGCFYSYFVDKKAVFLETLRLYFESFSTTIHEKFAPIAKSSGGDRKVMIRGLIDVILEAHTVLTGFHNELEGMYHSDKDIHEFVDAQHEDMLNFTISYFESFREDIKAKNLLAAAEVVYWSVHNVIDSIAFNRLRSDKEVVIDELVCMLERYLF